MHPKNALSNNKLFGVSKIYIIVPHISGISTCLPNPDYYNTLSPLYKTCYV